MRLTFAIFVGSLFAGSLSGQSTYPMITHVTPVAVQRGKTTEITVDGKMNFFGVYKVLFEGEGLSAEVVAPAAQKPAAGPVPNVTSVKLKLTVADNAPLGVREFRVASPLGVSSIG